jgi:hypothetical protein
MISAVPLSVMARAAPLRSQAGVPVKASTNAATGICTDRPSVAIVGPSSSTACAHR